MIYQKPDTKAEQKNAVTFICLNMNQNLSYITKFRAFFEIKKCLDPK